MAVEYVFEDKDSAPLSQLFAYCYPEDVGVHFHYANGNGNLKALVRSFPVTSTIYVFMDVVPDNAETRRLYLRLCRLRATYPKLFVLPLKCAEYYAIKFLWERFPHCITACGWAQAALSDLSWTSAAQCLHLDASQVSRATNFETFCKRALYNMSTACLHRGLFFDAACPCTDTCVCPPASLYEKSRTFALTYPCRPYGIRGKVGATEEEIRDLCINLCAEFNSAASRYPVRRRADPIQPCFLIK